MIDQCYDLIHPYVSIHVRRNSFPIQVLLGIKITKILYMINVEKLNGFRDIVIFWTILLKQFAYVCLRV